MTAAPGLEYDGRAMRSRWVEQNILPHAQAMTGRLHRTGVGDTAIEDLLHDSYVRLLQAGSVDHVRNARGYFSSALRSVVVSKARRTLCVEEIAHDPAHFAELHAEAPSAEESIDAKRQLAKVECALAGLSERVRKVVILRRLERLSARETAKRLAISESAVEKNLARGMKVLRRARNGRGAP